ncbi:MAG: alpha/beta fold hydrolase [Zoogloea sp.]|nr:alpha/beta fold hydrolase [Zoogloea sp.]
MLAVRTQPTHPARRQRGLLFSLLTVLLLGYGAVITGIGLNQESLLFHPEALPADFSFAGRYPPEQDFEEIRIAVDGAELDALLFRQPASRGLVFYLHGNAGNLVTWTNNVDYYRRLGFDLFMLDYRGFGKSTGHIASEAQLHADVRTAWDRVAPAYTGKPVVILGRSLGSGLAARLAADVTPDLLVLVSPYASLEQVAKERFPLVPGMLLKYPLRSDQLMGTLKSPVLITHGDRDEVIPFAHAQALLTASGGQAELVQVEGARHGDIHRFPAYLDGLSRRLMALTGEPAPTR